MGDVSFMIDIRTQDTGTAAEITSLEELEKAMKKEASAISVLEAMQKRLAKSTAVDTAALQRMKAATEAHQQKLGGLTDAFAKHSQNANDLVGKQKEGATGSKLWNLAMMKLGSTSLASGEQLAAIGGKANTIMKVVAYAKLAIGALGALYRAGAKVVDLELKLGRAAYETTKAQQSAAVTTQGLSGNTRMAAALSGAVGRLSDRYGVSAEKLNGFAGELLKAGVHGKDFTNSLRGLAIQQAATGEADVSGYLEQLKSGTKTAAEFAAEQEKIYGPAAIARGKTLESGIDRLKRHFGEMLATPEVQAGLDRALGAVERFLGSAEGKMAAANLASALSTGLQALPGLISTAASALPKLAEAFKVVSSVVSSALGPLVSFVSTIAKAAAAVVNFVGKAASKGGVFGGLEFVPLADTVRAKMAADGAAAGQGLAAGIAAGEASGMAVVQAASAALASAATSAVQAALQIHSPSRVFAALGRNTAEGFAQGVNDNGAPQDAVRAMVSEPREKVGRAGAGRSITIGDINVYGVKDGEHAGELIEAKILELLEAVAA